MEPIFAVAVVAASDLAVVAVLSVQSFSLLIECSACL